MDNFTLTIFIISILKLGLSQWIYWDAAKNKIGKRKGKKEFLNIPAGAWGFLSLLGIIGLLTIILYLVNRKKLIEKALIDPVALSKKHRVIVHIILFAIPIAAAFVQ